MSFVVSKVNACTHKFSFQLENINLANYIKMALIHKQKTAELKGYRKGKVPLDVVERIYGPQLENEALSRFMYEQIENAVKEQRISPVEYPKIENVKHNDGKLSFDVLIETMPEINLRPYQNYKFKKDDVSVTNEEVQQTKERLISSKAELQTIEDENYACVLGDTVIISFQGLLDDGSAPENMKGEHYSLVLGSNSFINGFEEGLVGVKLNESRKLKLQFPADYHAEDLKGKNVLFAVSVSGIQKKILPAFDTAMLAEFGVSSIEELDEKVRQQLQLQKNKVAQEKLEKDVLEKFIAENHFEVPSSMIQSQKKIIMQQVTTDLKRSGLKDDMIAKYFEHWDKDLLEKALFQVKAAFLLETLSKDLNVDVAPHDITEKYQVISKGSGMSVEEVENFYKKNEQAHRNLFFSMKEELTFKKLFETIGLDK